MVTYEAHDNAPRTMFKTFDKSIKIDDFVVVPTDTRHKMTVCKVVDTDVDVDFDSSTQISWIIGRIDLADVTEIKRSEEAAIQAIKQAEKLKKQRELKNSMEALLAETGSDIKLLTIGKCATEEVVSA